MRESLYEFCMREGRGELLEQWLKEKNFPITPRDISYGSKRKVWWRCEKGHVWQAAVYTRTGSGVGCPFCAGKIPVAGENDLETRYPELARQWHCVRNGELTPNHVLPGSHKSVWWVCDKGHEWRAQIKSRVAGSGCPVCANRQILPAENDLASRFPEIAAQWHPTKNKMLAPDMVAPGSKRKVWWICDKGHEWRTVVFARTSGGSGCPVCSGKRVLAGENDLASKFPDIAAQWHPTKNGTLTPEQVTSCANRKVWWICPLGHEYRAAVGARTQRGSGCPYCAGKKVLAGFNDLATLAPVVAKQWHPVLNGSLTPEMVTPGSHRKVWWRCGFGHVWQAVVHSRTGPRATGCPVCTGHVSRRRLAFYRSLSAGAEEKETMRL